MSDINERLRVLPTPDGHGVSLRLLVREDKLQLGCACGWFRQISHDEAGGYGPLWQDRMLEFAREHFRLFPAVSEFSLDAQPVLTLEQARSLSSAEITGRLLQPGICRHDKAPLIRVLIERAADKANR